MSKKKIKPFGSSINRSLKQYFADLKGTDPADLHQQMTEELERHLLIFVMSHTGRNVSRSAKILGISRATLRKKLRKYDIRRD